MISLAMRATAGSEQSDRGPLGAKSTDESTRPKTLYTTQSYGNLMLELLMLLVILMAKRKGGSRYLHFKGSRYIPGNVQLDIVLTTLAAATAVLAATDVVDDTTRISSVVAMYSLEDFTDGAGIGPIVVGLAHSDYSLAEVEAWIKLSTGWSQADLVSQEISNRRIRRIGVFESDGASGTDVSVLNDGKPIKTKLNWRLSEGQGINFWAFNSGSNAIATTVPRVHVEGKGNLWLL